jgi:hypothetical protein
MDEVLWEWVTADKIVQKGPCFFCGADLSPSAAAATVTIYDGQDTGGKVIDILVTAVKSNWQLQPPGKLRCNQGIYVDVGSNVSGVLVFYQLITGGGGK